MPFVADSIQLLLRYLTKEALEWPGNFRIGGQIIRTVKYGDDLVYCLRKKRCNGA
jgi:hypothetical protein